MLCGLVSQWSAFGVKGVSVAPRSQRIVLVLSRSGIQAQLGEIQVFFFFFFSPV
jgi:hypothetical protein